MKQLIFFGNENSLNAFVECFGLASIKAIVLSPDRTNPYELKKKLNEQKPGLRWLKYPIKKCGRAAFIYQLRQLDVPLFLVYGFSKILPESIFSIPSHGTVNLHGGKLPEYRGANILNWVLVRGEKETAITLHQIDGGVDTGPIIATRCVEILPEDDALSLRQKLFREGNLLLMVWLPRMLQKKIEGLKQEEARARKFPRRKPVDGYFTWGQSAEEIHNLTRALVAPWPGAWTKINHGKKLVLRKTEIVDDGVKQPHGQLQTKELPYTVVQCGVGSLRIIKAEVNGEVLNPKEIRRLL